MIEILCITHKYPPMVGGMEQQSYELTRGLSKYYKTHVIAYNNGNKALWFAQLKSKIKSTLKENPNIQLIHLNDGSMGAACLWLRKFTDIPIIVTYHGLDITFPLSYYQKKLIPKLTKYDGAICVSRSTKKECLKRGFKEDSTYVVKNGVDKSLSEIPFDPAIVNKLKEKYGVDISGKHVLVMLGRPVKRKGFSWFLKHVMPHLNEDIYLLMIGPINPKHTFFEKALHAASEDLSRKIQLMLGAQSDAQEVEEQLEHVENAFHLGRFPYSDLLQILSLADLFIMPNIHVTGDIEGFGLVALEASIRGTYVLASGIEGITDAIIDGENGCLLPSADAGKWIEKIHELLADKEKLNALSEHGKEFTRQNYSWELMVDGYKAVFEKYIGLK